MRVVDVKPCYQETLKSGTLEESDTTIYAYFYCANCKAVSDGIIEDNLVVDINENGKICGIELILPKEELLEKEIPEISGENAAILVSDDNQQTFEWYIDNKNNKRKVIIGVSDTWEKTYKLSDTVCIGVKDNIIVMWWFKLPT